MQVPIVYNHKPTQPPQPKVKLIRRSDKQLGRTVQRAQQPQQQQQLSRQQQRSQEHQQQESLFKKVETEDSQMIFNTPIIDEFELKREANIYEFKISEKPHQQNERIRSTSFHDDSILQLSTDDSVNLGKLRFVTADDVRSLFQKEIKPEITSMIKAEIHPLEARINARLDQQDERLDRITEIVSQINKKLENKFGVQE